MKDYSFGDLLTYSGATRSELTNWVQTETIRPDVRDTSGTGSHRVFGFLDVFEAAVAHALNQVPGGMPTEQLQKAFDVLRFFAGFPETPWNRFLDPARRDRHTELWLCQAPPAYPRLVETGQLHAALGGAKSVLIVLPLHTVLLALEQATNDYATAEERQRAFTREQPRQKARREALEEATRDERRDERVVEQ